MTTDLDRTVAAAEVERALGDGPRLVRGTVRYDGGREVAGAVVVALDKRLRTEVELGRATTDTAGAFAITYQPTGPVSAVDLLVRVLGPGGAAVLAEAPVVFGAADVEQIDLTVDGGPTTTWSEYERLLADLQPHLAGVAIADLGERTGQQDVTLLAGKIGQDAERVAALVVAHKLARRTGLAPEVHYALVRKDLPTNLSALLATQPAVRRQALDAAVQERIVPGALAGKGDQLDAAIRAAAVRYGAGAGPMAKLLGGVLDQAGDRESFLTRYAAHVDAATQAGTDGDIATFWTQLAQDARLGPKVPDLQFTVQASALSGGHAPLVNRLRTMRAAGQLTSLRQAARLTLADWKGVITAQPVADQVPPEITGPDQAARVTLYAQTLERIVLDAMPTQVMAFRAQADQTRSAGLRTFWTNVTTRGVAFELGAVRVEEFVAAHPELLQGVADPAALTRELKATQRVFNLTARHSETAGLLDAGLTSATAVARLNRDDFVQRHSALFGDPERAALVHAKAAHVAASAMATVAAYSPQFNTVELASVLTPNAVTVPTLATLFGSLDSCACEHCRSAVGPAAYYAEVLEFLSQRGAASSPNNALKVLSQRRPDLTEIELTCANTNAELPYLDLVNELLEDAVAPFVPFGLAVAFGAELDARTVSANLRAAFAAQRHPLTADHIVVVGQPGIRWFVTDNSTHYTVVKQAGVITVTAHTRQTGADAVRLAASPEHVNTAAYDVLRSAVFPLTLPLDLWRAETTTFLSHLGVDRGTLMTELSAQSPWTALTRPDVVAERLGISAGEHSVLVGGTAVRLASTAAIATLAGTPTIDGVATAAGQLVLVKDQPDARQNGVYLTAAGPWVPRELPGLLAVTEGTANKNTTWRLEPIPTGVRGRRVLPWDFYGLAQQGNPVETFNGGVTPHTTNLDWLSALTWVPTLLGRLSVGYEELIDLLTTRYVNPGGTVRITSADPADPATCELWKLRLTGTAQPFFERLQLFVRLWRRLGWTPAELDAAIETLQGGVTDPVKRISEVLLRGCLHVDLLTTRLGLSREQVLTFWSTIPSIGPDPLYRRLFQNPAVVNPVDPNFALVGGELAVAVTDPANARISQHTATLVAALGVSAADLATLAAALVPSDTLTLATVSDLHRHALLARGLGLPVGELLTLAAMTGLPVFAATQTHHVLHLVELLDRVVAAGTTVPELDHLLNHRGTAPPWAPTDQQIATALDELRAALRTVREATTPPRDADAEVLSARLAGVGWPAELVQTVLTALSDEVVYTAPLTALPAGFQIPEALLGRVSWADRLLRVVGPLTVAEREALVAAAPTSTDLNAAVKSIFGQARFALQGLAVRWPTFQVPLAVLPAGVRFPAGVDQRVFHDAATGRLCFRGVMSGDDRRVLLALSTDGAYRAAVEALHAAPATHEPDPANTLCSGTDTSALFDQPTTEAARLTYVLGRLLTVLRTETGTEVTAQHLAGALSAPPQVVRALLTSGLHAAAPEPATSATEFAIADLLAEPFLASDPEVPVTAAAFGPQFATYRRLAKTLRLTATLRLRPAQLGWLTLAGVPNRSVPWLPAAGAPATGWLRPDQLPVQPQPPAVTRFAAWLRLVELAALRDRVPGGADTVDAVLTAARVPATPPKQLTAVVAERTGWDADLVTALVAPGVLNVAAPTGFQDETGLARLLAAVTRVERLGATVAQCVAFTAPAPTAADGRAAVQLAKARYTDAEWSTVARPLRDTLREAQRDALVAYLVSHPDPTRGQRWRDVSGLYDHFLIDPEMSACMVTSRLKQAISSAQLFVQRCLLGLESGPPMNNSGWVDWQWMKNYRVWEAARTVFLHPENWLDPELRADKSPLFVEAESELAQDNVTRETAERVLANYIRGLTQVARLEPAGMYRTGSAVHLFARSPGATAPAYYHRTQVNGRWTAWQRIDLDISANQIMPLVWKKRLFLFWPVFTEELGAPVMGGSGPPAAAPTQRHRIQLAWSEYAQGKWQPRNVTSVDQAALSYCEKTINYQCVKQRVHQPYEHFLRSEIDGDELFVWPVVGRNKGFLGVEKDNDGIQYGVRRWHFTLAGPTNQAFFLTVKAVVGPSGTRSDGNDFVEWDTSRLRLPTLDDTDATVFDKSTGQAGYRLTYLHRDDTVTGDNVFLLRDDVKTYLVTPRVVQQWVCDSISPARVEPGVTDVLWRQYYRPGSDPGLTPRWGVADTVPVRAAAAIEAPSGARDTETSRIPDLIDDDAIDEVTTLVGGYQSARRYQFSTFFHPFGRDLLEDLLGGGATSLLARGNQLQAQSTNFVNRYAPTVMVDTTHPVEDVDFSYGGGYSIYNWELFFHLPLLIAGRLTANQRFEEAQRWLHFVFNPTDATTLAVPQKYWQTKPLYQLSSQEILADRIDKILAMLAGGDPPDDLAQEVDQWRDSPFDPHTVARLRPTAYAKNVVMRYLDNLIAWGDQLFRRDTLETINEATQLYVLAAQLLGPRPATIPPRATPQVRTYSTLDLDLDGLSNDLVDIEYLFGSSRPDAVTGSPNTPPVPLPKLLYFGVPANDKLLGYWGTVADRLFKIRHCMNIDGVQRQLPLFEPPIDPGLLVQATAAGADIASAIADAAAPLPVYRFRTLAAKAVELCQHVQQLGNALLQSLEKRDAEDLAVLRAGHELELLRTMEAVRQQQHEAAVKQLDTLRAARAQAMARFVHYQRIRGVTQPQRPGEGADIPEVDLPAGASVVDADGTKLIGHEQQQSKELNRAHEIDEIAAGWEFASTLAHYTPNLTIATLPWGVGGSLTFGGQHIGPALQGVANRWRTTGSRHSLGSTRAGLLAGLVHRETEAVLQQNLAGKDLAHIDRQLAEAAIRERVAFTELTNHQLQVAQSQGTEEFLLGKYTNAGLFNWMSGRIAQTYFAGYQLAHDVATRAERAYRFELGLDSSTFVRYGYWDSLRKGLLAGETLQHDIQRMQVAFLDLNRREHELTKHVSLASLHPEGLVALRQQGSCYLELPEAVFDLDQPGHYLRRIRSVSVTIPCTTGPYTNVTAKLTLLANRVRVNPATSPGYGWTGPQDPRFRYDSGGAQSIVTSSGNDDAGLFRPDLDDERYLPFEGAGAISAWRIELPETFRQFDYSSITDVVLHLRYTARDAGGPLRAAATADLADAVRSMRVGAEPTDQGLFRLVTARSELGDAWPLFLHPTGSAAHTLPVPLGPDRFPAHVRDRALKITRVAVFARLADGIGYDPADPLTLRLVGPGGTRTELPLLVAPTELGGLPAASVTLATPVAVSATTPWSIEVTRIPTALGEDVTVGGTTVRRFREGVLADVGIVWGYTF